MKKTFVYSSLLAIILLACQASKSTSEMKLCPDSVAEQITNDMKSFVSIFEIPATDILRAISFYESILDINIESIEMPGIEMGLFPTEGQLVYGVLVKGEGYNPSLNGVTLYLDGGDDLQVILDRIDRLGGDIIMPKTPHGDESGYFALFKDSEGNKMGLHSVN